MVGGNDKLLPGRPNELVADPDPVFACLEGAMGRIGGWRRRHGFGRNRRGWDAPSFEATKSPRRIGAPSPNDPRRTGGEGHGAAQLGMVHHGRGESSQHRDGVHVPRIYRRTSMIPRLQRSTGGHHNRGRHWTLPRPLSRPPLLCSIFCWILTSMLGAYPAAFAQPDTDARPSPPAPGSRGPPR